MAELSGPWLVGLMTTAVALIGMSALPWHARASRWVAVAITVAMLGLCALLLMDLPADRAAVLSDPWDPSALLGGPALLRFDILSSALLPFAVILFAVTVGLAPTAILDRHVLRRQASALGLTLLAFATRDPIILAGCWTASIGSLLLDLRGRADRRTLRIAAAYLLPSIALIIGGLTLISDTGSDGRLHTAGAVLVALAVMIRKGIFPLHSWLPEVFEHGHLGSTMAFCAPQLGTWVAVTVLLPAAPTAVLSTVAALSLVTSVYGALAALAQADARRALGWLFASQSALVLVGIESDSVRGLAGGLSVWLSSGLAFAGLALALGVHEARRGRLRLDRLNGGYERMPMLATSFLLLSLACFGFPGTFGFVAQELLVGGATDQFPHIGFLVIVATTLTAIAMIRMYFSLFCGADPGRLPMRLLRRETAFLVALTALVIIAGLAPAQLIASRSAAAATLLEARERKQRLGWHLVPAEPTTEPATEPTTEPTTWLAPGAPASVPAGRGPAATGYSHACLRRYGGDDVGVGAARLPGRPDEVAGISPDRLPHEAARSAKRAYSTTGHVQGDDNAEL